MERMARNAGKLLCKLGLHKWSPWVVHPYNARFDVRECSRCKISQQEAAV